MRLEQLADTVTPKELAILSTLRQVRLASAAQLERLHFTETFPRYRRQVLQSMTERGLVTRLDRVVGGRRSGSAGYLYGLGVAGQRLLLQGEGVRVRRPTTPGAPFVSHALAVTELATRLREAERRGQVEVLDLQTEPDCWRRHPGPGGGSVVCKPDGYVRLGAGAFEDSYFMELDLATESPSTLDRKLDAYRRYWTSGIEQSRRGVFPRVLWIVPDLRRHQVVTDAISHQPAEAWQLHLCTLFEDAVGLMVGATS
jgi:hypothetical protein